ncbi:MAG: DUF3021 domain-containing protein [Defluviitaleaceae bacterium]|nr:DUF3021 domain-containing protein [Defluviitaleaceae bacterium]
MFKQTIIRAALGATLGVAIAYVITVIISVIYADGYFHPVVPTLTEQFGGELNAVLFQTALAAIHGATTGAASMIWNIERWSLAKQTGIFFLALSAITLPISCLAHWMPRSTTGFLIYIAIFIVIYVKICAANYFFWRTHIKKINEKISR